MFAEGETCSAGSDKRPIWSALGLDSVNHNAPSGPVVMPMDELPTVGIGNSVITPAVVMRPILSPSSVNHSAPAGPVVMPAGAGTGNSVITPAVVMRPILPANSSVNHSAPSGPCVMPPRSWLLADGTTNSVITPAVVMRPILLANDSVNHSAPSGPVVMLQGPPSTVATANSVKVTASAWSATPATPDNA